MPRDLSSLVSDSIGSSDNNNSEQQHEPQDEPMMFRNAAQNQSNSKRDDLHPYTQTLTLSDIDSCVLLEEAAFPPQERATREKVSPV